MIDPTLSRTLALLAETLDNNGRKRLVALVDSDAPLSSYPTEWQAFVNSHANGLQIRANAALAVLPLSDASREKFLAIVKSAGTFDQLPDTIRLLIEQSEQDQEN